jgi:hypothetical protein
MALVAALFYWMSNPLVFIPSFFLSFEDAKLWTKVAMLVTLPWLRLPRVPWPWLLFLGLCYASQLWSISDTNTDLSNLVYAQVALMAFAVAANCEPLVVCWGLGLGGVVVVALSELAYKRDLLGASYIAMGRDGVVDRVLAGIGTNENILAYTIGISFAAILASGSPTRLLLRALWWVVLSINAYGLYRSGSGTGYLATLVVLGTAALVLGWPRLKQASSRVRALGMTLAALVPLAAVLVVTVLLGKDLTTISGRAPFWRATVEASMETSPWLGSGWGAVWEHPWNAAQPNSVVQLIYAKAGYALPHGHNFFVDVLPELGLVGVVAAMLMVVHAFGTARKVGVGVGRDAADPVPGRLVLYVVLAIMVFGVTEPMLAVPLGWWSLAIVVAVARQRVLAPRLRGRRRSGRPVDPRGRDQLGEVAPIGVGDQHRSVPTVEDEHAPGRHR